MAIKRVWIEEGCTLCGLCEDIAPEVFEMGEESSVVKEGVDFSQYEDQIKEAAESCPTGVIQFEE